MLIHRRGAARRILGNKMLTKFDVALKKLPAGTGFDSFAHKTVEDLCWICLHELDMHAEAEHFAPMALRRQYLAFCKRYGFYAREADEAFQGGLTVRKSDCYDY